MSSSGVLADSVAAWATRFPEHRVNAISSTPTFMRRFLHFGSAELWARQAIEQFVPGGEIVDDAILSALRSAAPLARITHVYATTELGPVIVVRDGRAGFDPALLDGQRLEVKDGPSAEYITGQTFVLDGGLTC